MDFRDVCLNLKLSTLCLLVLAFTPGCFVNPGSQSMPAGALSVSYSPVYSGASGSYILASGSCSGAQSVSFVASSPLTSSETLSGTCVNNNVSLQIPVSSGTTTQLFTITATSMIRNTMSTPVTTTVNFSPAPPITPAFAILTGGGTTANGTVTIFSSIGEVVSPATLTGGGYTLRTGVQGVNDP